VTFHFGLFDVDPAAYELRRKGKRVRLARQPMDLLLLLLERRGELVSHDDIAKRLWGEGVFGDLDAGIHTAILKIRQALDDSRESPLFIETVPGKGYRFAAKLEHAPSNTHATDGTPTSGGRLKHARHHNLPTELTSFVGRRRELAELSQLFDGARLLSLIGAGGVGKTRLALRLVSDRVDQIPGGVWLLDMAPLASPDLITQAIATIFGVRESPQRSVCDALLDYMADRKQVLVFDTCEHLIDACAELAEAMLRRAPALRIVATSREALGVQGEVVYRVPSLSLPDPAQPMAAEILAKSEAMQLFMERAIATDSAFRLNESAAGAIARICRRLDGIPLAIELAAARVAVLSPEQIEVRLENQLRLLTTGTRTAVARQRTLEATVGWSYQLLSEGERLLFCRLSVFPTSWTLDAAEEVCAGHGIDATEAFDLLSRLVGKSLVTLERDEGDERRYRFLETVQHFARQRLRDAGCTDTLRDRHFHFFYEEFGGALHPLSGPDQVRWLKRLQIEHENVRAALDWGLSSASLAERAVELAGSLFWYWTKRGLFEEGRLWLERAVALPVPPRLRARALIGLGHMDYFQGRLARTFACNEEALALGRAEGDMWVVAFALFGQALYKFESRELQQAAAFAVESREAARNHPELEAGSPEMILATVALMSNDVDGALRLFDEATESKRRIGNAWALGILLSLTAGLRTIRGEFDLARIHATEAMSLCEQLEDPRGIAYNLDVFAGLLAAQGRAEDAARLWGASDGLLEKVGGSLMPSIAWIRDRYIESVKTQLGEDVFAAVHAQGCAMPAEEAIACVPER
jgi:non-specific serine/threonine protein kinase